ncbi:MAG: 3-deoxy-D-manno-octulosonic acid transferase [Sideroxydans sp.]|nr:3-deoxy-D-manno-octulosonic acid transferase [Sideroxydans sp.]
MNRPRIFYSLLLWLLLPYIFFHLLWRARKQPEYLEHVPERFGFYRVHTDKPVIWLHTVSVGETRAVATLVKKLRETYPGHQLLLTHTTPTGRAESERLYGEDVRRVYLPYDYSFAVDRFLKQFRPAVGVLMETEIWPNLIHACHAGQVPLLLLNARLSEKSARRYARYPKLARLALRELSAIAAQTPVDAERLQELGAVEVSVMGNLKFDIEPPVEMLELGKILRQRFGADRKVFLAASTREGEEVLLLDMLERLDIPGLLTVIVPRHPQRFGEIAALLGQRNISFVRRSDEQAATLETRVVLGDSMGEMFAYYAACDVAFVGGSLLPFGGQNLIEACAAGKPVLIGPHTYNFAEASNRAVGRGAATSVADSNELVENLQMLFAEPQRLAAMGRSGLDFVRMEQGATERALEFIVRLLSK